ncbi:Hypothetical predicted protein [Podarcis lilfordi]|uniref:Reverse transcriptase domain-containing protein n=1 Tax=Podarcis lilfordi TaxID=74358 RepID=A0AA35LEY7_9SAUR|nr:Hypothetical predicted protein [Podarcis lilfordi]
MGSPKTSSSWIWYSGTTSSGRNLASLDVAKAFDSVAHRTIKETLQMMGIPNPMTHYISDVYDRSTTVLSCGGATSQEFHPRCGVKQGDPMSPCIFNMIMDSLLRKIPKEVGADLGEGVTVNGVAFADDLVFVASTPVGLQTTIDIVGRHLALCGLTVNSGKSLTVSLEVIPKEKKTVVNLRQVFTCNSKPLQALKRSDQWHYLDVPFKPEGHMATRPLDHLKELLDTIGKAPLKPQQWMFGFRAVAIPSALYGLNHSGTAQQSGPLCEDGSEKVARSPR